MHRGHSFGSGFFTVAADDGCEPGGTDGKESRRRSVNMVLTGVDGVSVLPPLVELPAAELWPVGVAGGGLRRNDIC